MITCFVSYELNPNKISEFEDYARMWVPLVERFGGIPHGFYLPREGVVRGNCLEWGRAVS